MSKKTDIYTGSRTITAKPAGPSYRDGLWLGYIDGRNYYGVSGYSEAEAIAAAYRAATKMDADDAIYPIAKAAAAHCDGMVPAEGQTKDDFFVGQRVAVISHNRRRAGIVEKVGRTNITVAVVGASTGHLSRATAKFADAVILERRDVLAEDDARTEAMIAKQIDKAEARRQDTIAQHEADGTAPGYGTAPGDEYCLGCACYHGADAHVVIAGVEYDEDGYEAEPVDENERIARAEVAEPARHSDDCAGCLPSPSGAGVHVGRHAAAAADDDDAGIAELAEEIRLHRLAGLRTERTKLRDRTRSQHRPELVARLAKVEEEIRNLGGCPEHLAYDADYCPGCRTATDILAAWEKEDAR